MLVIPQTIKYSFIWRTDMSEKEEIKTDYKITHEDEVDHEEFIKILNEETLDIDWKATAKENIKSIFELEEKLKNFKKANQELQDYIIEDLAPHANMYRKELEELKEKNKKLNKEWKEWRDLADELARITEQRNKYKSALEEIREKLKYWETYFCDNCPFQNKDLCDKGKKDIGENTCTSVHFIRIQNKINEVLNEQNSK